jgi:hypothetical protein
MMVAGCGRSAPPAPDCTSCAVRDVVIAEQVLEEQAGAIGELRSDVALPIPARGLRLGILMGM